MDVLPSLGNPNPKEIDGSNRRCNPGFGADVSGDGGLCVEHRIYD